MKKLIFVLIITSLIFSCKQKPKFTTPQRSQMAERGGELLSHIRGAVDSLHATTIDIYLLDDYFYIYREQTARNENDSMGVWSTNCGTWSQTSDGMKFTIPDDGFTRIAIPFDISDTPKQMNAGDWDYCCECNSQAGCCMAWPSGSSGYYCLPCSQNNPCSGACVAVGTDFAGGGMGRSFIFTHTNLTMQKVILVDL